MALETSTFLHPTIQMPLGRRMQMYPPPTGSVLYLPGYPPGGSTIYDRSNAFYDSAINTNEDVDISETPIDVTPDATTAIPVGSVIRIESEQMLVSATGTTLTVSRGYNGTAPATHANATDIYRLTTNHGTITGATWTRLASGLWVLSFDGTDDYVNCGNAASLNFGTTDFSVKFWFKTVTTAATQYLLTKDRMEAWTTAGRRGFGFYITANTGLLTAGIFRGDDSNIKTRVSVANVGDGKLHCAAATFDRDGVLTAYVDGLSLGAGTDISTVGDISSNTGLYLGIHADLLNLDFAGQIALGGICSGLWTATQVANSFNQERHLFV